MNDKTLDNGKAQIIVTPYTYPSPLFEKTCSNFTPSKSWYV